MLRFGRCRDLWTGLQGHLDSCRDDGCKAARKKLRPKGVIVLRALSAEGRPLAGNGTKANGSVNGSCR